MSVQGAECMSEDESTALIFADQDGSIPTARVTYGRQGGATHANVSFTRIDLDRTVVQLKFAVDSLVNHVKTDNRFHATDGTAGAPWCQRRSGGGVAVCDAHHVACSCSCTPPARVPVHSGACARLQRACPELMPRRLILCWVTWAGSDGEAVHTAAQVNAGCHR